MAIELSFEEAKRLIEEAIAEKGDDYVYEKQYSERFGRDTCLYFQGGKPGCIIGHILARLGFVPDEAFTDEFEGNNVSALYDYDFLEADHRTLRLLSEVQHQQDNGLTWGDAYEAGLEAAGAA